MGSDRKAMTEERPHIAPDDEDSCRPVVLSVAELEELCFEWYMHGICSTGYGFHGESDVIEHAGMRAQIRIGFKRLYEKRRRG